MADKMADKMADISCLCSVSFDHINLVRYVSFCIMAVLSEARRTHFVGYRVLGTALVGEGLCMCVCVCVSEINKTALKLLVTKCRRHLDLRNTTCVT